MAKKILIIDDDANFVMMVSSRLKANQYEVANATNVVDAIQTAVNWKPDLILLDMMMPAMEGYEVCEKLKSQEETRRIPILILTACNKKEYQIKCLKAGALVIIMKPFNPIELLALIKKAFDSNSKWRRPENYE